MVSLEGSSSVLADFSHTGLPSHKPGVLTAQRTDTSLAFPPSGRPPPLPSALPACLDKDCSIAGLLFVGRGWRAIPCDAVVTSGIPRLHVKIEGFLVIRSPANPYCLLSMTDLASLLHGRPHAQIILNQAIDSHLLPAARIPRASENTLPPSRHWFRPSPHPRLMDTQ